MWFLLLLLSFVMMFWNQRKLTPRWQSLWKFKIFSLWTLEVDLCHEHIWCHEQSSNCHVNVRQYVMHVLLLKSKWLSCLPESALFEFYWIKCDLSPSYEGFYIHSWIYDSQLWAITAKVSILQKRSTLCEIWPRRFSCCTIVFMTTAKSVSF